jgi:Ca-activated chloride channel family protein
MIPFSVVPLANIPSKYRDRRAFSKWFACLSATIIILAIRNFAHAQTNLLLNQGNKYYDQQRYQEAEADYTKALARDPNNPSGLFNLGNTLYQEKRYDSSRKIMEATANAVKDKGGKAAANYNIGNTYMSQKKWEDAANSYKQTLRNNPQDADAKYNLSYAEEMLKKQQQQNKNQDKQNQDKQNKDQKDKDKKDQQNKDQQKKDDKQDKGGDKDKKDDQQDQQQAQAQPGKLSQQQAEQLLNALQQEEKKLQDKLKKEKGIPVKMEKDW